MIEEFSGDFLQQLRGFYYVAQLGSMGQAAKVMHRSQSSVSRLIKQLEQSLDVELFSRVQKGVVLTSEGNELFIQTVAIFERIRSIHSELGNVSREPVGPVFFQISHLAFISFVAPLLDELCELYPKLKLNILEAVNLSQLQRRLEERSIDFAFVVGGALPDSLDFYPLFTDKMVLVCAEKIAGQIKTPLRLEDLPDLPIIKLPSGSGFSLFVENHLPAGWQAARQNLVAGSMFYQLHMAASGLGFAITAESSLQLAQTLRLGVFQLDHLMPVQEYGLVHLKNSYMTPQTRAVTSFFKSHARV